MKGYCQTNHFGYYEIEHIVPDNYQVLVTKLGFGSQDNEISISDDETMNFIIGTTSKTNPSIIPLDLDFNLSNYPNPFNPFTTISFENISTQKNSKLEIYNLQGQKIRRFSIINNQSSVLWDGTDERKNPVSSGIYIYKLHSGEISNIKKMLLIK